MRNLFLCFLCCGRADLLQETVSSFKEKCLNLDQFKVHVVVSDDSGDEFLNSRIEEVLRNSLGDITNSFSFRFGTNVGQAASYWKCVENIEKLNPREEDLVFLIEEDWRFTEAFDVLGLKDVLSEKISGEEIASATLKCDVDNFHEYHQQGYNLVHHNKYFVVAPRDLRHLAYTSGECVHNEIICFHPTVMLWNRVINYKKRYSCDSLIHIKESAEKLLGIITKGLRAYIVDKVYAVHTGSYRLHSVFPGAKIRNGVTMTNVSDLKQKFS